MSLSVSVPQRTIVLNTNIFFFIKATSQRRRDYFQISLINEGFRVSGCGRRRPGRRVKIQEKKLGGKKKKDLAELQKLLKHVKNQQFFNSQLVIFICLFRWWQRLSFRLCQLGLAAGSKAQAWPRLALLLSSPHTVIHMPITALRSAGRRGAGAGQKGAADWSDGRAGQRLCAEYFQQALIGPFIPTSLQNESGQRYDQLYRAGLC